MKKFLLSVFVFSVLTQSGYLFSQTITCGNGVMQPVSVCQYPASMFSATPGARNCNKSCDTQDDNCGPGFYGPGWKACAGQQTTTASCLATTGIPTVGMGNHLGYAANGSTCDRPITAEECRFHPLLDGGTVNCGAIRRCDTIKQYFDPPLPESASCEFERVPATSCRDGQGTVVQTCYKYRHKPSGLVAPELICTENTSDAQCNQTEINICSRPDGSECYSDDPYNYTDPPGPPSDPDWPPTGPDVPCDIFTAGPEGCPCDVNQTCGGGSGGGTDPPDPPDPPDKPSDPWVGTCNKNSPDWPGCLNWGGGAGGPGAGGEWTGGSGGDSGSGGWISGGGGSGDLPGQGGDGTEFSINFGSAVDAKAAAEEGGWGETDGEGIFRDYLDSLWGNDLFGKIRGNAYINTTGMICAVPFTVSQGQFLLDLCPYEPYLVLLGQILRAVVALGGLILILRR